jgi:flagellar basal body L-ring protein FlgH
MRIFILISIVAVLSACGNTMEKSNSEEKQTTTELKFDLLKSEYVILPLDSSVSWLSIFNEAKPAELSQSELAEIEEIIEIAIKENNKQQNQELVKHNNTNPDNQLTETGYELKLGGFKRQYVSVINEKGGKEIWINFFCDDWGNEKWKSEILIVKDGGNCYFNIKVNLTTKTYSELRINGYA